MSNINQDVMTNICQFMDVYDVVNCSAVNKEWNEYINSSVSIWQIFEKALIIEPAHPSNPKESIKKFFTISLGIDEAEIKKDWSETLRKQIRKLPYIKREKIVFSRFSTYYLPKFLFKHVTTTIRTTDINDDFVLCCPRRNDKNEIIAINLKKFMWYQELKEADREPGEEPPTKRLKVVLTRPLMRQECYLPNSYPEPSFYETSSDPNHTLSQFIEMELKKVLDTCS